MAAFAIAPAAEAAGKQDVAVLNFALVLEYLQSSFYTEAERSKALRGKAEDAATRVGAVERAHVTAFKELLGPQGGQAADVQLPRHDRGRAAVPQDGRRVRGPRGGRLQGPGAAAARQAVLAAAVAIHSVEARHAAWMRFLFGVQPAVNAFDDASAKAEVQRVVGRDELRRRAPAHQDPPEAALHRVSRRTLAAAGLGVVAACAVAALGGCCCGGDGQAAPRRAVLPAPPRPALGVPAPQGLGGGARTWRSGRPCCDGDGRARPRRDARTVARLRRRTPEGTANVVLVTGRASDARGRVWVRVRLPVLPERDDRVGPAHVRSAPIRPSARTSSSTAAG